MSETPEQAAPPAEKKSSRLISCLLLTACLFPACFLPLYLLPLWIRFPWVLALLLLALAALLTLACGRAARRRGYARQEAQALFLRRTLLYGLAVSLLQCLQPEIELTGVGPGRLFDALLHLDMYTLRLIIRILQLVFALLACVRLLWSIVTVPTRLPLAGYPKFRNVCLVVYVVLPLLAFVLLGGVITYIANVENLLP